MAILLTVAIISFLVYRNVILSRDWIIVWEKENEMLRRAPVTCIEKMNRPAAVLLRDPIYYNGHHCFVGNWDLSSAMRVYYRHDKAVANCLKDIFFAPFASYQNIINRTGPGAFSDVLIWDYDSGKVFDPRAGVLLP